MLYVIALPIPVGLLAAECHKEVYAGYAEGVPGIYRRVCRGSERVSVMERDQAEQLERKYREFCEWFEETTALTMAMNDQDFAKSIRRSLVEMLYQLDDSIREPVSKEHPDLFPDDLE